MPELKDSPKINEANLKEINPAEETSSKTKKTKKSKKIKNSADGKKSKIGLVIFLIIMALVAGLVVITVLNVGNFRDKYIIPALSNIPIVKNILPQQSPESNLSKDELLVEKGKLEDDVTVKDSVIKDLNDQIESLNAEMKRLREIEAEQLAFKQQKEEFDSLIALNSPIDYKKYYESISPENAEKLYKEVVASVQINKDTRTYAEYFGAMKAKNAAQILEEMMLTDMELVVLIMKNIDPDQCSAILAAMDTINAASVSKQLSPQQ